MAHSKSAIKRWRQSIQRRDRNRAIKSRTRTLLAKALDSIDGAEDDAEDAVRAAIASLDSAAQKGVIHANAAARSKSRILKRFNLATAGAVAAAASGEAPKPSRRRAATKKDEPAAEEKPARGRAAKDEDKKPARGRLRKS